MNWKIFLVGSGLLSSFFVSIALIAVYYDDSAYTAITHNGSSPYYPDTDYPDRPPYTPTEKPNSGQKHEP